MPTSAFQLATVALRECSIPEARLARIDIVFVLHDSAIHPSTVALAAPNVVCVLDVNFRITSSNLVQR